MPYRLISIALRALGTELGGPMYVPLNCQCTVLRRAIL